MYVVAGATLRTLNPYVTGVGEKDWAFKTTFEVTEAELASPNVDLLFEGLDTFATVKLVSENKTSSN